MPLEVVCANGAHDLDDRIFDKRVGFIALTNDYVSEPELGQLLRHLNIGFYVNRVEYSDPVNSESLRGVAPHLTDAARQILPGDELDFLVFGCTAGTAAIGEDEVVRRLGMAKPSARIVTPVGAIASALNEEKIQRVSILTACDEQTSVPIAAYFEDRGFVVDRLTCLGLADGKEMARISKHSLIALARDATAPASEALLICGSAMRVALIIKELEEAIGVPCFSSNSAIARILLQT